MTDPDDLMGNLEHQLKPYRGRFPSFATLPKVGMDTDEVAGLVEALAAAEEHRWRDGFASGAVYHGDPEHVAFLNRVYAAQSQSNPLHPDLWPSATKFEAEIVSMTAHMLGAGHASAEAPVVGAVSSGGTESILLAMKAYRDFAESAEASPSLRSSRPSPRTPRSTRPRSSSTCRWSGSPSAPTSRPMWPRWPTP